MLRKALILSHHHEPSPRVLSEAKTLASEGYVVTILVWRRSIDDYMVLKEVFDVDFVSLEAGRGSLRLFWALPTLYMKLYFAIRAANPDVIHVTHLMLLPLAVVYSCLQRTPVVYDSYERHAVDIASYFPVARTIIRKSVELFESFLVSHISAVLTTDSPGGVLARRYKRYAPFVEVIYNVPDLSIKPDPERVLQLRHHYSGYKLLVYAGVLSVAKGLTRYLELIKNLERMESPVKLLLIGLYDQEEEFFVEKLIKEYGTKGKVEVIAWLPYRELLAYLKVCHIALALHQPNENFRLVSKGTGRKFFTYMLSGLPIVGSNFAEVSEIVRETNCGILVDPQSTESITAAVKKLLAEEDYARALGERGRRAVYERYNWQVEQAKLLKFYKLVCQSIAGRD